MNIRKNKKKKANLKNGSHYKMSDVCLCYGFKFKIYKLFQRIVLYSKLYEKQNILFLQCNAESHSRKNVFINNFKLFYADFFFSMHT